MDEGQAAVIAAIIGAVAGFIGGGIVAAMNYRQKEDELFFKALDFLGGGSQKRNLGIAAIEYYWNKKRHRNICISLLIGTAIYLLSESKQKEAAHELHNLERIMNLLIANKDLNKTQKSSYEKLIVAVVESEQRAIKPTTVAQPPSNADGLVVNQNPLGQWRTDLSNIVK